MLWEYVAKECEEKCVTHVFGLGKDAHNNDRKKFHDAGKVTCPHHYPYRRVFSGHVVSRYKTVHAPDTRNEREFTSRAEYSRFLYDRSREAEERTGIPHDFQPIDLNDPSVIPPE